MTNEEKAKIKELRLEGLGYKCISKILGLTRDCVRGFCKRNGLAGNSSVVALNIEEKIKKNLVCTRCEKIIKQKYKGRARKFCSDECRRKWWNENQDKKNKKETSIYEYTCLYCKNKFSVYGNKKRKYCSHDCYIKDRFWREEDGI